MNVIWWETKGRTGYTQCGRYMANISTFIMILKSIHCKMHMTLKHNDCIQGYILNMTFDIKVIIKAIGYTHFTSCRVCLIKDEESYSFSTKDKGHVPSFNEQIIAICFLITLHHINGSPSALVIIDIMWHAQFTSMVVCTQQWNVPDKRIFSEIKQILWNVHHCNNDLWYSAKKEKSFQIAYTLKLWLVPGIFSNPNFFVFLYTSEKMT